MAPTTIRNKPKPFTWSYSRLKNFETCAFRHQQIDLLKAIKEEESEALMYGNEAHKALATRIEKGTALPHAFADFEHWCEKVGTGEGIYVEQKMAFTREFKDCGYFDKTVWFRGVGDVIKKTGRVALVLDWKTGKIVEDSCQLALMAQCIFARFPDVEAVRSEFIWLKEDAQTSQVFKRADMADLWAGLLPRVKAMELAEQSQNYPKKPGGLCKRWCPVSGCEHHGG